MKLKYINIIIVFVFLCYAGYSQNDTAKIRSNTDFKYEKTITGNFIYLNVDMLDNIYVITAGNQLKKLNNKGDSLAVFNDVKKYGNPSYIDVSNPLKILVYYKNFSTIITLDRLLTLRNTINLRKQNIFSVKAVSTSYDNNIWLYDEQDNKLKKVDEDGHLLLESTDLRLLVDAAPTPSQIIDNENFVYLYDEKKGFYIFDYYGALKNNLPFTGWANTTVARKKMAGFEGNTLFSYELSSLNLRKYELPAFFKDYQNIISMNGKLYLLKMDGIEIYSVQ